ncbi:MAG TPA: hypothetical protein DCG75_02040 [Bacteroidales bacterium]|nr:hypothetical protein [Bacteroidales bacterium]
MDKEYFSLENQMKRIEENERREKNKRCFKKKMKNSTFSILPAWHLTKSEIDLSHIANDCHKDLKKDSDYSLYLINKEELFRILDDCYRTVYTKEKIWKSHEPDKITSVLESWENSNKLIPPILILDLKEEKFLIQDGKHRFAVANYFDAVYIPVIILNQIEKLFLKLANNSLIKKLE